MDNATKSLEPTSSFSDNEELGYGAILNVVIRRWPWFLGVFSISILFSILSALRSKPVYMSSMQLIVEPNFEAQVDFDNISNSSGNRVDEIDYATQLNVMRSEQFLAETLSRLQSTYSDLSLEQVKDNFRLDRVEEGDTLTRIFSATYKGDDPVLTQRFLEELTNVYLNYNEDQQTQRISRGLDYIDNQLASTRASLQFSQAALERFRENASIIDPSTQAQQLVEALNEIAAEKRQLQAELSETRSRYQLLQEQLELSPNSALLASRLSQSSNVQELLNQLQTTELALAERRAVFTDADPTMQLLLEKRQSLRALLQETVNSVSRQSATGLDPDSLSALQLGDVDLTLVSDLLLSSSALEGLNSRFQRLQQSESELQDQLNTYPGLIAEYDRLQPEVEIERATLQRLLAEREQLTSELAKGGFVWQIIEEANLGSEIGPSSFRQLLLGVVIGVFLGGISAFLAELLDDTLRSTGDIKTKVSYPLLGTLPKLKTIPKFQLLRDDTPPQGLSTVQARSSDRSWSETAIKPSYSALVHSTFDTHFRESLDIISNALDLKHIKHHRKAIAISSGVRGEGKTTTAVGIAHSLARMNQRILLVDADLRHSGFQNQLNHEMEIGLSALLNSHDSNYSTSLTKSVVPVDFGSVRIDLLPSGPVTPDPLLLLSSSKFQEIISEYAERYDVVLVDTPPVLDAADAIRIAATCDGLVLVTQLNYTSRNNLADTVTVLDVANVLGVVVVGETN